MPKSRSGAACCGGSRSRRRVCRETRAPPSGRIGMRFLPEPKDRHPAIRRRPAKCLIPKMTQTIRNPGISTADHHGAAGVPAQPDAPEGIGVEYHEQQYDHKDQGSSLWSGQRFCCIIFLCFLPSCGHIPCIIRPGGLYSGIRTQGLVKHVGRTDRKEKKITFRV